METPKGLYEAPFLLLCTGAWTGEVGRTLGLEIPVQPVRRMVFATAPTPFPHAFPLTVDLGTGFYFRSEEAAWSSRAHISALRPPTRMRT